MNRLPRRVYNIFKLCTLLYMQTVSTVPSQRLVITAFLSTAIIYFFIYLNQFRFLCYSKFLYYFPIIKFAILKDKRELVTSYTLHQRWQKCILVIGICARFIEILFGLYRLHCSQKFLADFAAFYWWRYVLQSSMWRNV